MPIDIEGWTLRDDGADNYLIDNGGNGVVVPAGGYFVWKEATYVAEAVLFGAVFLPGVLMGWVCLVAFGRPMLAMLRSDL